MVLSQVSRKRETNVGKIQREIDMASVRIRLAGGESKSSIARSLKVPRQTLCHRIDHPELDNVPIGTERNGVTKKPPTDPREGLEAERLKNVDGSYEETKRAGEQTHQQQNDDGSQTLSSTGSRITSIPELLKACNIDPEYWEAYDGVVQSYEGMRKDVKKDLEFDEGKITGYVYDEGKLHVETLFKIKVKIRKREEKKIEELVELHRQMMDEREPMDFSFHVVTEPKSTDEDAVTLELATTDIHMSGLSWSKETNDDSWTTDKAVVEYLESSRYLVRHAGHFAKVGKIVIPFGNDFFNSDNASQQTHKGTQQHDDSRWQRSFSIGGDAMCQLGEGFAREGYEVEFLLVQGNHDWERSYYLGDKLKSHFRNTPNVTVDNQPCAIKYRLHGVTLVGYEHGHARMKDKDKTGIMADTAPADLWAGALFKEWHHGHIHHQKVLDDGRVTIRWFRALCPLSSWAAANGYRGIRAAQACMYHPTMGPLDQYNWYPRTCKRR